MPRKPLNGLTLLAGLLCAATAWAGPADEVLRATGTTGGLVVCIGCGDGSLLADLAARPGFVVQGLDTSAENVAKARETLAAKGLLGRASARTFDGKTLPYRDDLVNLIVAEADCAVPREEILRVLAPNGTAWLGGTKTVKPRPADLDEWTHYQHDPQGTMVSRDERVGPPRGIQWLADPKWLRNHDFMSSLHAMVSASGRVFYVLDEGLRQHIFLPARWRLIARDAASGVLLWKRNLKDWHPNNWPLKSGPGQFPRRLVAVGDRVFVTFGQTEPLSALDAATGRTLRTYDGTKATEEILYEGGVLYLLVNPGRKPIDYRAQGTSYREIARANNGWAWKSEAPPASVTAVEAESGRTLWKHADRVVPLTLTLSADSVFYANGRGVVALDRRTGRPRWTSDGPAVKTVPTGGTMRAVYADGVLLVAQGINVTAFSAEDGRRLWTERLLHSSHHCPNDLFVIDGLVWSANTGTAQRGGTHLKAIDLHTGEVKKDFRAKNPPVFPMHPRCYPSRATTRYLITNGMGAEFYRIGAEVLQPFNYIRGSCIYGLMPANGLLYKPPDSCACYYQSKLEYLCALTTTSGLPTAEAESPRLEKGPAYGAVGGPAAVPGPDSWPMYRADPERSGWARAPVPDALRPAWTADLGGRLTQPVVADGRVFVASVHRHTLFALDAGTGRILWTFRAGGRIDSAPTVAGGAVYFGSADGQIYALRAADGALAWCYRAAPADRQMVARDQVESVWPVHGSVLLAGGRLWAVAGRNLFFDGGLRLVGLDPKTGRRLTETVMDEKDPATGRNLQSLIVHKYMPVANADILSSDGLRLYMQEQNFDLAGRRLGLAPTRITAPPNVPRGRPHLFCQTGLLDDLWFHRSYWIYGTDCGEGWADYAKTRNYFPCGRLLVFNDRRVFGYRSEPLGNMLLPRTTYKLYAADKPAAPAPAEARATRIDPPPSAPTKAVPQAASKADPRAPKAAKGEKKRAAAPAKGRRTGRQPRRPAYTTHWAVETPGLLVQAMVLAGDRLWIAGPPDLAEEAKMLGYLPGARDDLNRQLAEQEAAWLGRRGGLLRAVATDDGTQRAEFRLPTIPVFDGMSAAGGRLFLSLIDGNVVCFAGE